MRKAKLYCLSVSPLACKAQLQQFAFLCRCVCPRWCRVRVWGSAAAPACWRGAFAVPIRFSGTSGNSRANKYCLPSCLSILVTLGLSYLKDVLSKRWRFPVARGSRGTADPAAALCSAHRLFSTPRQPNAISQHQQSRGSCREPLTASAKPPCSVWNGLPSAGAGRGARSEPQRACERAGCVWLGRSLQTACPLARRAQLVS